MLRRGPGRGTILKSDSNQVSGFSYQFHISKIEVTIAKIAYLKFKGKMGNNQ